MAQRVIVSAAYADHENTAVNSTYDDGKIRYVVMASNSKHKRELDAWVAAGNTIAPCPLPPGMVEDPISLRIEAVEEYANELQEQIAELEERITALENP